MSYGESPMHYAENAAEAVRGLNRATIGSHAYQRPSEVDFVLGELHLTLSRLEQALTQAGRWLTRAEAAGQIGHDQGHDPTTTVLAAVERLCAIGLRSELLADDLNAVRQVTSRLTGTA